MRLIILVLLICCISCQPDSSPSITSGSSDGSSPTVYESKESPQISSLIEAGSLKLTLPITPVAEVKEDAKPFGEIIKLNIKNETGERLYFRLDCGTVLRATDPRFQDLIVSRSSQGNIAPYEVWSGNIEVFALELQRIYPIKPVEYRIGNIVTGELRKFIECFCFRRPEEETGQTLDLTPVQYAIWRLSDKVTLSYLLAYANQQGNPSDKEKQEAQEKAKEQGESAEKLLEDCGITVKFLD